MAKVMVSLSDDLLERIDAEARRRGSTRSALLRTAVDRELTRRDPTVIAHAIEEAREILGGVGEFESGELIRSERDRLDARDSHLAPTP